MKEREEISIVVFVLPDFISYDCVWTLYSVRFRIQYWCLRGDSSVLGHTDSRIEDVESFPTYT